MPRAGGHSGVLAQQKGAASLAFEWSYVHRAPPSFAAPSFSTSTTGAELKFQMCHHTEPPAHTRWVPEFADMGSANSQNQTQFQLRSAAHKATCASVQMGNRTSFILCPAPGAPRSVHGSGCPRENSLTMVFGSSKVSKDGQNAVRCLFRQRFL